MGLIQVIKGLKEIIKGLNGPRFEDYGHYPLGPMHPREPYPIKDVIVAPAFLLLDPEESSEERKARLKEMLEGEPGADAVWYFGIEEGLSERHIIYGGRFIAQYALADALENSRLNSEGAKRIAEGRRKFLGIDGSYRKQFELPTDAMYVPVRGVFFGGHGRRRMDVPIFEGWYKDWGKEVPLHLGTQERIDAFVERSIEAIVANQP